MDGSARGADGPLAGARIVLGVSGGVAAYKAAHLARLLVTAGAQVDAVLTRGGAHFIGAATFSGITGRPTATEVWERPDLVPHIQLARGAAAVVVAPATAHVIAKATHGLADDLLTNVLLMARSPIVLAPAMHTEMWQHPATRANVAALHERGAVIVGPVEGELAGGDVGEGRMAEPEQIIAALEATLGATRDLAGLRVVITAGGTREYLDPVRFIGNRSSGKMGYALAAEAVRRGATVDLVTAATQLPAPAGTTVHAVESALEMRAVVVGLAETADVIVKAAAVADFRPVEVAANKLKKAQGPPKVVLEPNPDILAELGAWRAQRGSDRPILVGFAAETEDVERNARDKLERKGVDLVVVNDVSQPDAGFEVDTNNVVVVGAAGRRVHLPLATKHQIARSLWDEIASLLR